MSKSYSPGPVGLGLQQPTTSRSATTLRNWTCALFSFAVASLLFFDTPTTWLHQQLRILKDEVPEPAKPAGGTWDWSKIEPSRELKWHSCFDGLYDCARLDLPMDWLSPSNDLRIVLAVIRLQADPESPAQYGGPVFFNPGGPGGSGVWSLRDHGHLIQSIVGRNHDIVTFDPRGVGASLPRIDCWGQDQKKRLWDLQDVGVPGAYPGVVGDAYVRAMAFSSVCEQSMNASQLLKHIGTPSHARDMLEILHKMGHEKLKYWGFSYGTILGGYFASMYPDKVERLVSDGNVDYLEWAENKHINFLRDTDKVMEAFYRSCYEAGPIVCAFHAESPDAIASRMNALLDTIQKKPVLVEPDDERGPDLPQLITWTRLKRLITGTMYQPLFMFPTFAKIVAALERGNGRPFYELLLSGDSQSSLCSTEAIPPNLPRLEEDNSEAYPAIACADGTPNHDSLDDFVEIIKRYKSISSIAGDINSIYRLVCVGRKVRPKWRFSGPFGGVTSHPILYIANMADNITPMISAKNNSELFPGSVILTQNSYGHTTLSAPSTCTAGYIRAYFQNGSLPLNDTACEPDYHLFQDLPHRKDDQLPSLASDDALSELSAASLELSRSSWLSAPRLIP